MKRPRGPIGLWALFLAVLAAVLWAVFLPDAPRTGDDALLSIGLPALAILTVAAIAWLASRERPAQRVERIPDLSPGSALSAIALCLVLLGTEAGVWLVLIGAGLFAAGVGSLLAELRAQRRGDA